MAQLGARVNGIHEVTGSIPVWSTNLRSPASMSELRLASHPSCVLRGCRPTITEAIHQARRRLSTIAAQRQLHRDGGLLGFLGRRRCSQKTALILWARRPCVRGQARNKSFGDPSGTNPANPEAHGRGEVLRVRAAKLRRPHALLHRRHSDWRDRLEAHNAGRCLHKANGRPWRIDLVVEFADERRAVAFERYLK